MEHFEERWSHVVLSAQRQLARTLANRHIAGFVEAMEAFYHLNRAHNSGDTDTWEFYRELIEGWRDQLSK